MSSRIRLLGTSRVDHRLRDDVNTQAIPLLTGEFTIVGTEQYSITGEAPKDLILLDGFRHAYIAKKPNRRKKCRTRDFVGPLECVTEYMICMIGMELPLKVAEGRLVRLPTTSSAHDVRFMSRYFLKMGEEQLTHGLELVARALELAPKDVEREIPPGKPAERKFYTVQLIDEVLQIVAKNSNELVLARLRDAFARMMAYDALVGANDRHPWNWAVIENVRTPQPLRFAPVYDTARGLFWNHPDEALEAEEPERSVVRYADGSMPLITIDGDASPSHFDVIDYMVNHAGDRYAASVRQVIHGFSPDRWRRLMHCRFRSLLSKMRLERVDRLLRYRHGKLQAICRRCSTPGST